MTLTSSGIRQKAFTLLEFLVASFLAVLLLTVLYQAFGEVARFFRPPARGPALEEILLEEALLRWQFRHLRERPKLLSQGRYLILPLDTPLGPLFAVYDLERKRYAEVVGTNLELEREDIPWLPAGLSSVKLYLLRNGEREELPLERFPPGGPVLLEAETVSGRKITLLVSSK